MLNKDKKDIMQAFKPFELEAKKLNYIKDPTDQQHALFFIYYPGHGCMSKNKTAAINVN